MQGRIQEFLSGGPNFGWGKLLLPHTPSHKSPLHVIIPCPLTVTWILHVKDSPLEHPVVLGYYGYKDCTDFVNINVKGMMRSKRKPERHCKMPRLDVKSEVKM